MGLHLARMTRHCHGFVNCGSRVASPEENFLLFGANCSEDCEVARRFINILMQQMKEVEGTSYIVVVNGEEKCVQFEFELLPNDMKYLAFIGGELSNAATYFSSFADVHKDSMNDLKSTFGAKSQNKWKPWNYANRLKVIAAVEEGKKN